MSFIFGKKPFHIQDATVALDLDTGDITMLLKVSPANKTKFLIEYLDIIGPAFENLNPDWVLIQHHTKGEVLLRLLSPDESKVTELFKDIQGCKRCAKISNNVLENVQKQVKECTAKKQLRDEELGEEGCEDDYEKIMKRISETIESNQECLKRISRFNSTPKTTGQGGISQTEKGKLRTLKSTIFGKGKRRQTTRTEKRQSRDKTGKGSASRIKGRI